jgi:transposase
LNYVVNPVVVFQNPWFPQKEQAMKYVGTDLHKHSITLCVVQKVRGRRKVRARRTFSCKSTGEIRDFFQQLGKFRVVVEATASYEWFFLLIEDLADRVVLAHPKKLRVIAESKHKTDKIDARVLAEFLAMEMIPEAYRPSPRVRQHRVLTRHRLWIQGRITSIKCKFRYKLSHYNADLAELFTKRGEQHVAKLAMSEADRFEVEALGEQLELLEKQLAQADQQLREFAEGAPTAEREAREVLATIPQVGAVTIDVVLSELGDWKRFRSVKKVVAYAGLDPGCRSSASKKLDLHITKEGSRRLRWVLVEAAWRLVRRSRRWGQLYERLKHNTGSCKKAIVGVARRLLCVMFAMLRTGQAYRMALEIPN